MSRSFNYIGFRLGFASPLSAPGNFTKFEITTSAPTLTIKGITIKVGDNKSKLGNVLINNNTDGGKSILYGSDYDETSCIALDYDLSTGLIEKITFFVLT